MHSIRFSAILLIVWFYLRQRHFIFFRLLLFVCFFCRSVYVPIVFDAVLLHQFGWVSVNSVRLFFPCKFIWLHFCVIFAFVCNLFHNCSSPSSQSIIFDLQQSCNGTIRFSFWCQCMHFKCWPHRLQCTACNGKWYEWKKKHTQRRLRLGKTVGVRQINRKMMHIFSAKQNAHKSPHLQTGKKAHTGNATNQKTAKKRWPHFNAKRKKYSANRPLSWGRMKKKYVNHFNK